MSLERFWPQLRQDSRDWLIANNGDALSRSVLNDITRVGGPVPSEAWSAGETDSDGFHLSDQGVDWIEAVASGETPDPPSVR